MWALACCLCAFAATSVNADDWPGWRNDGTGVSDRATPPVEFQVETDLLWRTEIPGKGMSSPVVSDGRVFLTTGIEGEQRDLVKNGVRLALIALGLLVASLHLLPGLGKAASASPTRSRLALRTLAPWATIAFFAGLAAGELLVNGDGAGSHLFEGSVSRIWLASGLTACLGLCAVALTARAAGMARWFLSTLILLFVLFFLLGMPDPRMYDDSNRLPELALFALGLLAGRGFRSRYRRWVLLATAATIVALLGYVVHLHLSGDQVWGYLRFRIVQGIAAGGVAAVVAARLLVGAVDDRREAQPSRRTPVLSGVVGGVLLLMTGLQFYEINYWLPGLGVTRSLVSIDLESGELQWRIGYRAPEELMVAATSHATPTVAAENGTAYAYFGKTGLFAADSSGTMLWHNKALPLVTYYGAATSPIADNGVVYLACDHQGQSYVTALDGSSGERLWTQNRESDASFGTPALASFNGQDQLIVAGGNLVAGYDLATGEERWSAPIHADQVVSSIVVAEDAAYVGGGFRNEPVTAYQAFSNDGIAAGTRLWVTEKPIVGYASPLVLDGRVYVMDNAGIATCLDARTGAILWRARVGGSYTASPVSADGRIYFASEQGEVTVIQPGDAYKLLAKSRIDERIVATPAVTGNRILLRTSSSLWCIGK